MGAAKGNKYAVGNKGGGRPSEYLPEFADQAYKLCLLGATDAEIADILGFTEQTINEWKKSHQDFFLALKKGKSQADANVADRLYQRAMGFEHDEEEIKTVTIAGGGSEIVRVPTRKIYAPDPTSAIFWLKNRQPKKWRDKQEIGMTDGDGKDVPAITVFRIPDNGRS
jgi:transposase-like protein